MPVFKTGDMWSVFNDVDHFIITTNSVIKNNGALVMGAGIAKHARDSFPGIDKEFGQIIQKHSDPYHLILAGKWGLFQVKHHFKDMASLSLIAGSTEDLVEHANHYPNHGYALNFPGIGNGGLAVGEVKSVLMELPNNVQIWSFA